MRLISFHNQQIRLVVTTIFVFTSSSAFAVVPGTVPGTIDQAPVEHADENAGENAHDGAGHPGDAQAGDVVSGVSDERPAEMAVVADIVVATRNVQVGDLIAPGDLVAKDGIGEPDEGFYGMQARRSIRAGAIVTRLSLQPPILVHRNTVVEMQYRSGGLVIRTEGRALDEGGAGDLVRVMNMGSRQTVTASVIGQSRVEVGG